VRKLKRARGEEVETSERFKVPNLIILIT